MNYRMLLEKYMQHVKNETGSTYIGTLLCPINALKVDFSPDEYRELVRIEDGNAVTEDEQLRLENLPD